MKIQTRSSGSACKSEDHQKIRQRRDCRMKWKFRYGSPFASAGQVKIFLSLITAFLCRFPSICLLLTDERIQLTEMFFFPSLFCLKEVVHFRSISEVTVLLIWSVSVELLSVTTSESTSPRRDLTCSSCVRVMISSGVTAADGRAAEDFQQSPVWEQDSFRQERLHLWLALQLHLRQSLCLFLWLHLQVLLQRTLRLFFRDLVRLTQPVPGLI